MPAYGHTVAAQPNGLAMAARWYGRNSRRQSYRKYIPKVYSISWTSTLMDAAFSIMRFDVTAGRVR